MFTGIIQDIGEITALDKHGDWIATVATALPLAQTAIGASIAHNGICLTVIELMPPAANSNRRQYKTQLSEETISKTTALHWAVGTRVNLETALRVGDELGGHYVSGHVDGIARLVKTVPAGESVVLHFDVPKQFAHFIAAKGSVTIDGVALTVNHVDGTQFDVNIIPHTQKVTTLGHMKVGDEANLEIDMIARYVERMRTPL